MLMISVIKMLKKMVIQFSPHAQVKYYVLKLNKSFAAVKIPPQ